MVTLIVNPTVVTLTFEEDKMSSTPIAIAKNDDGTVLAIISITHFTEGSRLFMTDHRTGLSWVSEPVDKSKVSNIDHLFQLLELMLNRINLTRIERFTNERFPK